MSALIPVRQTQDFLTEIFFEKNFKLKNLGLMCTYVLDLMLQTIPCFYAETLVLRPCQRVIDQMIDVIWFGVI